MATSINDFLTYVPLTEMVELVKSGVPNPLGDRVPAFFNLKEEVFGNKYGRVGFNGSRRLARNNPYLAPGKQTKKSSFTQQDRTLLSPKETMPFMEEFRDIFRNFKNFDPQKGRFLELLKKQTMQQKANFDSFRIMAVHSLIALGGIIYLDSDGYILASSSGADLTIDMGVPAANKNQIGGLISASWATAATDIVSQLLNIRSAAVKATGRVLKYAFYSKNIVGYMSSNTSIQAYLSRDNTAGLRDKFITTGDIPNGLFDFEWVKVQDSFYDTAAGVATEIFPADLVAFTPDITSDVYTMVEGTTPVPKEFAAFANTAEQLMSNYEEKRGLVQYAWGTMEPPQINQVMADCFCPEIKVPNAFFFADVTP